MAATAPLKKDGRLKLMRRWLVCIQIWYGCSLGISDDLINFWDESITNKTAAAAI